MSETKPDPVICKNCTTQIVLGRDDRWFHAPSMESVPCGTPEPPDDLA